MNLYKSTLRSFLSEFASSLRKSRGMTQEEMAEKLRITGRAYSDLERGHLLFFNSCPHFSAADAQGR